MNSNEFQVSNDIRMIREIQEISQEKLAIDLDVTCLTVKRWENEIMDLSEANIEKLYSYAYSKAININKIKEQLYKEDYTDNEHIILFHGAKKLIEGVLDINKSRDNNDFGKGFYCGETIEQSAMFVSSYSGSSIYILDFHCKGLKGVKYTVDQDWMLTIAYFRGKLNEYKESFRIKELIHRMEDADYIIAPIADNRMFQIIDSFIDGEITDEQCRHCLSATNLGYQYVFKTQKALERIRLLERCYLCKYEKEMYIKRRWEDNKVSEDKVKIARRQYRGKGLYIDDILI